MFKVLRASTLLVLWHLANLPIHKLQIQVCLLLFGWAMGDDNMCDEQYMLANSFLPSSFASADEV